MRTPRIPIDRERMVEWLRSMANDLENGGAYTKGTVQFRTVRSEEVTVTYTITGKRIKLTVNQ